MLRGNETNQAGDGRRARDVEPEAGIGGEGAKLANLAIFSKFLAGSFSAVSKRNFARKYAFDSSFQALQNVHTSAPLRTQFFSKKAV